MGNWDEVIESFKQDISFVEQEIEDRKSTLANLRLGLESAKVKRLGFEIDEILNVNKAYLNWGFTKGGIWFNQFSIKIRIDGIHEENSTMFLFVTQLTNDEKELRSLLVPIHIIESMRDENHT